MRFLTDPPRPFFQRCIQDLARWFFRQVLLVFFQLRVHGLKNVPVKDGMIICANHQSNMDPVVIGCALPRRTNYLGKKSLFSFPPLAWFLKVTDTIPLDRNRSGAAGMKETLRRLRRNESILIFPEGHRSLDGELQPFRPGIVALAKRVDSPVLPVGIDGPFQCWPPNAKFPKTGYVHVVFGKPVSPEEMSGLQDEEITEIVYQRVQQCFLEARYRRNESQFDRNA